MTEEQTLEYSQEDLTEIVRLMKELSRTKMQLQFYADRTADLG